MPHTEPIQTETVQRGDVEYRISIYQDEVAESPMDRHAMGSILSATRECGEYEPAEAEDQILNNPDAVALEYIETTTTWRVARDREDWEGAWIPDKETMKEARNYTGRTRQIFMERRAREVCKVYSRWLSGEFVGYVVDKVTTCPHCGHESAELVDSCWGFDDPQYALECANDAIPTESDPLPVDPHTCEEED